mmetsp:Transcript_31241/g.57133  ORF Transcript_31241/g.57133 Transcript_31241/m.57133 type:complete len:199 (-) Transcript_31241:61-657(-)
MRSLPFNSSWLRKAVALLFFTSCRWCAHAGKTDLGYQDWAAKTFDAADEKGLQMGATLACVFCNVATSAVRKQFDLNRNLPRDERYSEDQVLEVLLELCENVAPKVARAANGYTKDAEMICKRVVKENVEDMLDAVSLGEDVEVFCKENKLCPFGFTDLQRFLGVMAKANAEDEGKERRKPKAGVIDGMASTEETVEL